MDRWIDRIIIARLHLHSMQHGKNWLKMDPYCQQQRCSPNNLSFSDILKRYSQTFLKMNSLERGIPCRKRRFEQYCSISGQWQKIGCNLVSFSNRKSHMVPKSGTLYEPEQHNDRRPALSLQIQPELFASG